MTQNKKSLILTANEEINREVSKPEVMRTLMATTFKGFKDERTIRQACLEAAMLGYTFEDLLRKNIYAIPFGNGYSLVQSIKHVRSIAMRNGHVGTDAPIFKEKDGKILSCETTVKRKIGDYIGDYTALVYFDEYFKPGKKYGGEYVPSNWETKPYTMIGKVSEMAALRKAFPEELSQAYVEEEFDSMKEEAPIKNNKRMEEALIKGKELKMGAKEVKAKEPQEIDEEEIPIIQINEEYETGKDAGVDIR